MATTTLGTQHMQPAEDIHAADNQPHDEFLASQPEYEIPDTKSGVRVDPDAAMVSSGFSITHAMPSHNALGKRAVQKGRCRPQASFRQWPAQQGCLHNLRPQIQSRGLCRVQAQGCLQHEGRIWMDSREGTEAW